MASEKTLNVKNLAALGADRLAVLLMELVAGDAAAKRLLRLELASHSGSGDVAAEIRKRLAAIAKSRSFVDWYKIRPLAADLDMQRSAIVKHVVPTAPAEAFDLLWRFVELAPSVYERCDDSNGTIGNIFADALNDLGAIAEQAKPDVGNLVDRVYAAIFANDYGQFDGVVSLMAPALSGQGLAMLKARLEERAALPPVNSKAADRKIIGISTRGPIYQDDFMARSYERRIQSALIDIADATGDADGYAAQYSAEERTNPAIAANIAERLLGAGRPEDAMAALKRAEKNDLSGRHWPAWHNIWIDTLDALGRAHDAQTARWAIFERNLDADALRAHLKRLPDFDDEETENRALDHVRQHADFHLALDFLIAWPALALAANLVLGRHAELDGNQYWSLGQAAEALEHNSPLAATLLLRSMISFSLDHGKSKRYGHANRHLQTCVYLAKQITDFGEHLDHEAYVESLKARHGRKSGFWKA